MKWSLGGGPRSSRTLIGSPGDRHGISQFFDIKLVDSRHLGHHPASVRVGISTKDNANHMRARPVQGSSIGEAN